MYELTNVTKTYHQGNRIVKALKPLTLSIADGELVAIQGPTGGGKSTLLQMLGALDRPTSGSITLAGTEISSAKDSDLATIRAEKIGFIFQNFNLIPTLTAVENVETALVPLNVPREESRERSLEALARVGLGERTGHRPSEMSGGQQQRVAIARALVKNPVLLLADEPTGNLDEETRDDVMTMLEDLWQSAGLTIILVTHDSSVAKRASRRLHIANGVVTDRGAKAGAAGRIAARA